MQAPKGLTRRQYSMIPNIYSSRMKARGRLPENGVHLNQQRHVWWQGFCLLPQTRNSGKAGSTLKARTMSAASDWELPEGSTYTFFTNRLTTQRQMQPLKICFSSRSSGPEGTQARPSSYRPLGLTGPFPLNPCSPRF